MSATLVSSNTTIKVNGAVSGTASTPALGGSATIYTAPANGYAIVQISCTVYGNPTTVSVGGRQVVVFGAVNAGTQGVYVGPSQGLTLSTGGGVSTVVASGVEFINTP